MTVAQVIDDVFSVFRERDRRKYGESVTETQHALQCATLAKRAGEPPRIIAACLLHDYGHLCCDLGDDLAGLGVDAAHENVGATRLSKFFATKVVEPIRLHVAAKHYLCCRESGYLTQLSEGSRRSLELQGGPMTEEAAREFEQNRHFDEAVLVRRYDDLGRVAEMKTPDFEYFRRTLEPFVRLPSQSVFHPDDYLREGRRIVACPPPLVHRSSTKRRWLSADPGG